MSAALAVVALSTPNAFSGEIHQWRDKDGNVHFGDEPPKDVASKRMEIRSNTYRTAPAPVSSRTARNKSESKPTSSEPPKVVLYSTAWCGYCKKAKAYFRTNNIAFTEFDIEKSASAKRDFKRLGGSGVPLILVGEKRVKGFSPAKFAKAYTSG